MHVLFLSYFYDPELPTATALLDRYYTTTCLAACLAAAGVESVSVVQRFKRNDTIERDGVVHHFIADDLPHRLEVGHDPHEVHRLVARLAPDVVHYGGTTAPLADLRSNLPPHSSLLWQHHGGGPPRGERERRAEPGFRAVDGFLFTAREQAVPWQEAGVIGRNQAVYELMEGSTRFRPLPRKGCRSRLGWGGEPLLLWVGRLDDNKDPLTVLRALAASRSQLPDPQLYMIYSDDTLLAEVEATLARLDLTRNVHLLGKLRHRDLPECFSAADVFVLGSHEEACGFALLEALACGVTPVVTDIPSFRRITGGGRVGALWRAGSTDELVKALLRVAKGPRDRRRTRQFFAENWSFDANARAAVGIYRNARGRALRRNC